MKSENQAPLEGFAKDAKQYASLKLELLKLKTYDKTSSIVSKLMLAITLMMIALMMLLFLFLALAIFLNSLFETQGIGFLIITGFYAIIFAVIYLCSGKITRKLQNIILGSLMDDEKEGEGDEK